MFLVDWFSWIYVSENVFYDIKLENAVYLMMIKYWKAAPSTGGSIYKGDTIRIYGERNKTLCILLDFNS